MQDEVKKTAPHFQSLPDKGLPVQVQCDGFRCMAFRDNEGRWIDLFTREILTRVYGIIPD